MSVLSRRAFLAGASSAIAATALTGARAGAAFAGSTWYVATNGVDGAAGTINEPVRTLRHAIWRATSGDTIIMRGGVYHEFAQIFRKALHIKSADGERAVLDGARVVSGFTASGSTWYHSGWTTQFARTVGDMINPAEPEAAYPDQMFYNGAPLRQVLQRSQVTSGTFFHDVNADRLYIGDDPNGATVEASDMSWALYFNQADNSRLTNITVRRYATEAKHRAAVRLDGTNIVASGVKAELNAYIGMSGIGEKIIFNDCELIDNGYIGLHGHQTTTFVVQRCLIRGNNKAKFSSLHSAAGMKLTEVTGLTVRDSDVSFNDGPGIWTDIATNYVTLSKNLCQGNGRSGIEVEISSNVVVVGNVAIDNGEAGIWVLESTNVQVVHNAAYRNEREIRVLEGPRDNEMDLFNVQVFNNIVGQGRQGQEALIAVDDWTEQSSADDKNVTMDYNAYWLPASSPWRNISRWARWPQSLALSETIAEHRSQTGQGQHSMMSDSGSNPYIRNAAAFDYRAPVGMALGAPLSGGVARHLDVADGTRFPIGPLSVTPRL